MQHGGYRKSSFLAQEQKDLHSLSKGEGRYDPTLKNVGSYLPSQAR